MPINYDELDSTDGFVLLDEGATVAEARLRLPEDPGARAWMYVVAPAAGGFVVTRWVELEEITRRSGWNIGPVRLDQLGALSARAGYTPAGEPAHPKLARVTLSELLARLTPAQAVDERATSTAEARRLRDAHPGRRLPVTSGGRLVRLLTVELMAAGDLAPSVIDAQLDAPAVLTDAAQRLPAPPAAPAIPDATPPDAAPAEAPPPADTRAINCWIERRVNDDPAASARPVAPSTPLLAGEPYELLLDVGRPRPGAVSGSDVPRLALKARQLGLTRFDILVELVVSPREFATYGPTQGTLVVPVAPLPSRNRVAFSIEPQPGVESGTITVNCYAFNRIVRQLRFQVGITEDAALAAQPAPGERLGPDASRGLLVEEALGRELAAREEAGQRRPEDRPPARETISLTVTPEGRDYRLSVAATGRVETALKLSPEKVDEILRNVRADLSAIVDTEHRGEYVYRAQTSIPAAVHQKTLVALARTGRRLFDRIFYHDQSDGAAQQIGDLLAQLSRERALNIEIAADHFPAPWTLVYPGDDPDSPDEDQFWGFKHTISYIPEFATWTVAAFSPRIVAQGALPLGFVFDTKVVSDPRHLQEVERHRSTVRALKHASVSEILTPPALLTLLKSADAPPLLYVYAHAGSVQTGERTADSTVIGSDASYLTVDGTRVTLGELRDAVRASAPKFASAPFVFLNACQGAERDAVQTDGLVSYLFARGARGVIATEVDTPAFFAAEFAEQFLAAFVAGELPVGELLLKLRRSYLKGKKNVMGLVYGLHANGGLRVYQLGGDTDGHSPAE